MTNFFKVYITGKNKIKRYKNIKHPEDVMKLLNIAKQEGCISYSIVKRTKQGTDIPILSGIFAKDFDTDYIEEKLNTDIRIIKNKFGGTSVVDWKSYCRYKSFEEER